MIYAQCIIYNLRKILTESQLSMRHENEKLKTIQISLEVPPTASATGSAGSAHQYRPHKRSIVV